MIQISNKADCCGCEACVQICPKNCITMETDAEGFRYPVVNSQSCVDCGLCERVCPILKKVRTTEQREVAAFAAYTKDETVRKSSSSGGIFSMLAEHILAQQGVVFGAAFAEDFSVHHISIENRTELEKLRGSKYVQSSTDDTYRQAKALLESGRVVLYTGVGCQIEGLKAFLGKDYDSLYTIDVLCHGVPSPKVWKKYLSEQEEKWGSPVVDAFFRNKRKGWKRYSVVLNFKNETQYGEIRSNDPYMRLFLANICLRPSCHSCRFKDIPRQSDLTIGDAWGIQNHMPEMDDDRGTSVVLVHTEKGRRLWEQVEPQMRVKQGKLDTLLPPGADSRKSVRMHANRKRFFALLDRGADMERLVKLTKKPLLRRILSAGKKCLKCLKNAL